MFNSSARENVEDVKNGTRYVTDKIKEAGGEFKDAMDKPFKEVTQAGCDVKNAACNLTSDVAGAVSDAGSEVAKYAKEAGNDLLDKVLSYVKENPGRSTLGLLAAGALIGMTCKK